MSEWIKVTDRLPQTQTMVLCYMPISYSGSGGIHYGWLSTDVRPALLGKPVWKEHSPHSYAHDMESERFTGCSGSKVTHWMPLPIVTKRVHDESYAMVKSGEA